MLNVIVDIIKDSFLLVAASFIVGAFAMISVPAVFTKKVRAENIKKFHGQIADADFKGYYSREVRSNFVTPLNTDNIRKREMLRAANEDLYDRYDLQHFAVWAETAARFNREQKQNTLYTEGAIRAARNERIRARSN